jgi:predicted GIY-YIG superfamily endonuclease
MQESLYVLQLEDGKYYVGKTKDVKRRVEEHSKGDGSTWTWIYRPVKVLETRPVKTEHDENNLTKDLMKKYGVDNVRGGSYCQEELPPPMKMALETELRGTTDACFKCGQKGHFANRCTAVDESESESEEEPTCTRCGRDGHERSQCYAKTHDNGYSLSSPKKQTTTQTGKCYRCGRAGHYSPDCYASTHARGYDLDD